MLGMKTQGSELYVLDPEHTETVLKIANVPNIEGIGGSAGDIDVTNLDSEAKEFFVGLEDNGTASFGLNLDPHAASHQWLYDNSGGRQLWWVVGCSDLKGVPPTDAGNGVPQPPPGRTCFVFQASVQQMQTNFATDDVIRVSGQLRVSGKVQLVPREVSSSS